MNLDKLKELAKAATPGPWHTDAGGYVVTTHPVNTPQGKIRMEIGVNYGDCSRDNREFIAAANPDTILKLLEYIEIMDSAQVGE